MAQSNCKSSPGLFDKCRLNSQTKPTDLGCEFRENWQLPSTFTIAIYYYYSA